MQTDEKKSLNKREAEMEAAINQVAIPLSTQEKQLLKKVLTKMEQEHVLPREAMGCTPEMMEVIYHHGYQLFYAGKYNESLPLFFTLRELDATDPRYSFAIAACYHRSHDYLNAAANYKLAHSLDPFEPLSCFYLYDCLMKANYPLSALIAIQEALVLAENNPKYQALKPKIELEHQHLKEFLKIYLHKKNASSALGE